MRGLGFDVVLKNIMQLSSLGLSVCEEFGYLYCFHSNVLVLIDKSMAPVVKLVENKGICHHLMNVTLLLHLLCYDNPTPLLDNGKMEPKITRDRGILVMAGRGD